MKVIAVFLLMSVATTVSAQAANDCILHGLTLIRDVEVTGYMYVKSGKRCGIQSANSAGGTLGVQIRQRAAHGTVQVSGLGLVYTPRAGFAGKDSFAYVRHSRDQRKNAPISFPVRIDVTVTP